MAVSFAYRKLIYHTHVDSQIEDPLERVNAKNEDHGRKRVILHEELEAPIYH